MSRISTQCSASKMRANESEAIAAELQRGRRRCPLENAVGRILAKDISAPFDVPGYVNSAMDGFAVRGGDLIADGETTLHLTGEIFAGGADIPKVEPGACVRITTGAPMPVGADTVVMKENTRVVGDSIVIAPGTARGANVRPAGEDFAKGDAALMQGDMLTASRVGCSRFVRFYASRRRCATPRRSVHDWRRADCAWHSAELRPHLRQQSFQPSAD